MGGSDSLVLHALLLTYLTLQSFAFSGSSSPDITVRVDWAYTTNLFTYSLLDPHRPDITVRVDWAYTINLFTYSLLDPHRPGITVRVDWAYTTNLFTYSLLDPQPGTRSNPNFIILVHYTTNVHKFLHSTLH